MTNIRWEDAMHLNRQQRRALGKMNNTKIPGVTMPQLGPKNKEESKPDDGKPEHMQS